MERPATVRSRSLPSPDQVAERLRSNHGASCSTDIPDGPQQRGAEQHGLRWQDIVTALRQGDIESASGPQILTDTFRCAHAFAVELRWSSWRHDPLQEAAFNSARTECCINVAAP